MNNIKFSEFVEVMDSIGKEYAELSKKKKMGLLYSGGIDSSAILLSLMRNNANISLVHWKFYSPPTSYSIFCEEMTTYMSRKYNIPFCFVQNPHGDGLEKGFGLIANHGFKDLINGEGIDSMFINYYNGYINPDGSSRNWGHGEPFRAFHPLLEMFSSYAPNRLAIYGMENDFNADLDVFVQAKRCAKSVGVTLYYYSIHPLMLDLIKHYKEDVGDIFFRKRLIEFYVKEKQGVSYNTLVREVCRLNKDRMEPIMKRFFTYMGEQKSRGRKKEADGNGSDINASC